MKSVTKVLAAAALLASASTATLAQVNVGGALDAGGSVSTDAGSTSIDAGANGNAGANANSNAGGDAGGSVGGNAAGSANANAAGGTRGDLNYGSIISDLRTSSVTTADVEAFVEGDTEITIVTLAELRGNAAENASALDQAVNAQAAALADLRTAIAANADITAELEAAGYTTGQVVAVTTSVEGDVTLVVDASAS